MMKLILLIGTVTNILLFGLYLFLLRGDMDVIHVQTFLFVAVGIDSLFYVFAVKHLRQSLFRSNPFSNMWLIASICLGFILMWIAIELPFFQSILKTSSLSLSDWGFILMIGMMKLFLIELGKKFLFSKRRLHKAV